MNRKNLVIIGLLVVGWIRFLGQPNAFSGKLRMVFVQLGTPFVKLGDYFPFVQSRRLLARQNEELRRENDALRRQVQGLGEVGRRNLQLEQELAFKERLPLHSLTARVIGRDASNWWKSIQIDRGSGDGLTNNLAVLNADGLIGKIISVTKGESRVLLLTDPNCKVSALLQNPPREPGVVAGIKAAFSSSPRCVMTYVNRDAKIKPGEPVISSGFGGIFPKGIPIGSVTHVEMNKQTGMYQDIEIKPAVNFRLLEEVIVITE